MLTVTENAAIVIRDLLAKADLPPSAGIRLAQREDHTALAITLTAEPGADDLVLETSGAPVFVGPVAAQRTAGPVLDASDTAFFLRA